MKAKLRWEAFATPPRRTRYRYADGELSEPSPDVHPPRVQSTLYLEDGCISPLTFFLTPDQADELASKLADAAAAARAMPVEDRVTDLDVTKAQVRGGQ